MSRLTLPTTLPSMGWMPYPRVKTPRARNGLLAGLRFGVKDVFHVAGYPTSMGQPTLAAALGVASRTAPLVQQLLDAGADCLGKTITDELAFSMTGHNVHYGQPINGAAPLRITGGSSTGSAAAVSHGEADFALGTDTGGSIRAPANHCGLWGLRPTHDRVSAQDVLPQAPSLDTCGWLARDAAVFARVTQAVFADSPEALGDAPQWLWPRDLWALMQPAARPHLQACVRRQLRDQPLHRLTLFDEAAGFSATATDEAYWAFRFIQGHEVWQQWGPWLQAQQPPLGAAIEQRMQWARTVTPAQVQSARQWRQRLRRHLDRVLGERGVLVLPTMPDIAPLRRTPESGLEAYRNRAIRLLCVAGLTGLPQVSVPLSTRLGAPLGVSLIGPRGRDQWLVQQAVPLRAED